MKINAILLLLLFLSCDNGLRGTTDNIASSDSLSIYIQKAEDNTKPLDQRKVFAEKASTILYSSKSNDSILRKDLFKIAVLYYNLGFYPEFKRTNSVILDKAILAKDTLQILRAYSYTAKYYTDLSVNDSAFYIYTKAEQIAQQYKNSAELADIYINKAFIQLYVNDYSGCELSASKALIYLKDDLDKKKIYDAYNLIGISSNEMKSYERAIDYHNRALKIVNEFNLNDSFHLASNSLNNIGVVYQNIDDHSKAVENFTNALREKNLLNDSPSLYAILLDNLAYSKLKAKDFKELPSLFLESLSIRDSLDLRSGIVVNKIHLSEYYATKGDTVRAQTFAFEALQMSRKSRVSGDLLGSLKQIALVDHKRSVAYQKEYIKISDSIQQAERLIRDRFGRIQFETDEISSEKNKLEEQNRNLLYIFIGTLTIGLLLFVIRTQRARNRELLMKQAQQKANEDIYNLMISQQSTIEDSRAREKKRIAQELHDGVLGRLFGARLNLDSLNRQTTEDAVMRRSDYLTELKNIEQDIREISHDLNREKYVLINNFIAILNNLLEEQKSSFEPELSVSIDESIKWESIGNTAKINLYRIIQESLQNINKYANASIVRVEIKTDVENIYLSVVDNGVGFQVTTKKKGIGVQNMISRVHELNGSFDIKSKRGKGTTVAISFPIEI